MIGIKDQRFGVEIEFTGITRQQAAEALARYFDTSPRHSYDGYDSWFVDDGEGNEWRIMNDSSIQKERWNGEQYIATGNGEYAVEMVTPILTYDKMEQLQECIRTVRNVGGKVNSSCGLHVHVDASNHDQQTLKNLMSIMYSKEDILFRALKVRPSREDHYCHKSREGVVEEARRLSSAHTQNYARLRDIWYGGYDGSHTHYDSTRYYALNLHSVFYRGTVEWRCFNSTLHAGRAKAYVNLCLAMSAQAINQRCSVMRKTQSDNELFTFRVWLVRMGLNGPEFKSTRDHLLANLEGDRAWRYDKDSYADKQPRNNHEER